MCQAKFVKIFAKPAEPAPLPPHGRRKYKLGPSYTAPASEIAYPYEGTFKVKTHQSHGMPTVDNVREKTTCGCFDFFFKKKKHHRSVTHDQDAVTDGKAAKLPRSERYAYQPLTP